MVSPIGAKPSMISFEGLGLDYIGRGEKTPAFEGIDAEVPAGSIAAIVGPSGCGKTSVLRCAAGLREPTRGRIAFGGAGEVAARGKADGAAPSRTVARAERPSPRRALILQDYGLLPWKTVSANVELPLLLERLPAAERRTRAARVVEELGLFPFAHFYPSRLSGGMRQRVALARAFVQEPELLLMDEPFSSLDALTREAMQETLLELQERRGATVLLVTHSIEEAAYLADRVYVMRERNPGRVVERIDAPAGRVRGPSFRSEASFLAYMSAIRRALEKPAAGEDGGKGERA
jgi:NitT/TauT family transport system ATP-binding protein